MWVRDRLILYNILEHLMTPMKRAHFLTSVAFMFAVLLPSAVGCGEIDLPQPDNGDQPGNVDNGGGSDNHGDAGGESGNGGSDNSGSGSGDNGSGSDNSGSGSGDNGSNSDNNGSGSGDNDSGDDLSGAMPAGQHAVITVDGHVLIDGRLYISVVDFRSIPGDGTTAPATASAYTEGNLSGWRVPTRSDVDLLLSLYRGETWYFGEGELPALNKALEQAQLEPLYLVERYLFDGGRSYFTLDIKASESTGAAQDDKKYYLRLVRDK